MALSEKTARGAAPREGMYRLSDGDGLYLQIQPNGLKLWRMRYRFAGREKMISLGQYSQINLKRARERRDEARKLLAEGLDPAAHSLRANAGAGENFEALAREWLEKQKSRLAPSTIALAQSMLERFIFPYIGHMPPRAVGAAHILDCLRRPESKGLHETAHRLKFRLSQIFRYGFAAGRVASDPTALLRGALLPVNQKNRAAITDPRAFGALLRAIDGYRGQPTTVAALKLIALTFLRPGELRMGKWSELDLKSPEPTWRVPAERMKMDREHLVPLSRQAVAELEALRPLTEHHGMIFPSLRPRRPLSENTLNAALRTMGFSGEDMTAHGFRASASTLLHEQGWPPEVIELQLAHAQKSQVAAAYNRAARLKDRREMMQAWADYADQLRRG